MFTRIVIVRADLQQPLWMLATAVDALLLDHIEVPREFEF